MCQYNVLYKDLFCRRRPSGNNMDQMGAAKNGSTHKIGGPDPALQGNPSTEENCRELVACIVTIGGIDELQTALHRHMPDQVEKLLCLLNCDIKPHGSLFVRASKASLKSVLIFPDKNSSSICSCVILKCRAILVQQSPSATNLQARTSAYVMKSDRRPCFYDSKCD